MNKIGNNNIKNQGKKFSSEYQPSPKAKSVGLIKWHERRKLKDDMYRELVGDGSENSENVFISGVRLIREHMSEYMSNSEDKLKVFFKLIDFFNEKDIDSTFQRNEVQENNPFNKLTDKESIELAKKIGILE